MDEEAGCNLLWEHVPEYAVCSATAAAAEGLLVRVAVRPALRERSDAAASLGVSGTRASTAPRALLLARHATLPKTVRRHHLQRARRGRPRWLAGKECLQGVLAAASCARHGVLARGMECWQGVLAAAGPFSTKTLALQGMECLQGVLAAAGGCIQHKKL